MEVFQTCMLLTLAVIHLASTSSAPSTEELAQRHYQLSLDTFGNVEARLRQQQTLFQQQQATFEAQLTMLQEKQTMLEEQQTRFEEKIRQLVEKISELESRPLSGGHGDYRMPDGGGDNGDGDNGGGDNGGGDNGGGDNGDGGSRKEPTEPPAPEPVVTETRTTMKVPSTVKITTTMKVPTTTTKATTAAPTTFAAFPRFEPTCHSIYRSGYTTSGDYTIDPDGFGSNAPYTVFCDMDNGEGITIVGHDSEERNIPVSGFEQPGSYILRPRYGSPDNEISMRQLGALTDASYECKQFVKYSCKASSLMRRDKKSGLTYAWWVDRYGVKHVNWGGAATDSGMCACGVTNTCFNGESTCSCDHPKARNQVDEGFLEDRSLLPVMTLNLGDTGSKKERGSVTLGKFICKG